MNQRQCTECGAYLNEGADCRDYLHTMIAWDFEDFTGVGKIHHLTVLSYNLQHPSVYSVRGLENAKQSLAEFIRNPTEYAAHGKRDMQNLASDVRDWKITGTFEDHGVYTTKPRWQMLASDVVNGGLGKYLDNVKKWGASVLKDLEDSGNMQ